MISKINIVMAVVFHYNANEIPKCFIKHVRYEHKSFLQ